MLPALLRHAWPSTIGFLSVMLLTSCLASASSGSVGRPPADLSQPSYLDYLVLTSMADSPHLMRMAAYRPTRADDSTRTADQRTPQRRP